MGEAGHVSAKLRRVLDRGSFEQARLLAFELTRVSLRDALDLTLLAADARPDEFDRYAIRWLERLGAERNPTLDDFAIAAQLLADVSSGRLPPTNALPPLERCLDGKRLG